MSPLILLAGGYEGQIHTLSFDPDANPPTLKLTSSAKCGLAPTWLVLSPTSPTLYVADEWGAGPSVLTSHTISPSGALTLTSATRSGAAETDEWPCHASLLLSTAPPRLLVATYQGCTLSSIPLLATGEFDTTEEGGGRQTISFLGTGETGPLAWRQDQDHPHAATVDPTGGFVVVPDLGTDCLKVLRVNAVGDLVRGTDVALTAGDGPRHVLFSVLASGETVLYVLNELSNSISSFAVAYPPTSLFPTFTPLQSSLSLLPSSPHPHQTDFSSWHAAELKLSRDGRTMIASNRAEGHDPANPPPGAEDVLALFEVDSRSGTLDQSSRKLVGSGGRAPRHLSLSSERVGAQDSDIDRRAHV